MVPTPSSLGVGLDPPLYKNNAQLIPWVSPENSAVLDFLTPFSRKTVPLGKLLGSTVPANLSGSCFINFPLKCPNWETVRLLGIGLPVVSRGEG